MKRSFTASVVLFSTMFYAVVCQAQLLGTTQLNVARRGHTATLLEDGKILIVGGDNSGGVVSQAELVDPSSQTSSLTAGSIVARTDHTANRLADGRVLVVGGRNQNGSLTSSEFFHPLTATFTAGPTLSTPRSGHTATLLSDGTILIVGGDTTNGSAEIYNPATETFLPVVGRSTMARKFHSSILTSSGQVLIVGGVNAQDTMLNSAEIYDPTSQTFYLPRTDMQTARAFAVLKLLSDGKIQIIGGDAELSVEVFDPITGIFNGKALLPPNVDLLGATLSTQSRAALFSPAISQDPLLQGVLTPDQLALLDSADHSITELPSLNQALVAGGINNAGQILNRATFVKSSSASITTDKNDYAPGEIVTITGTNFQPNERVDIYFHEFPEEYPDIFLSVVANQQGSFLAAEFAPQEIDLGRVFTLTAIGRLSAFTAQTAFKDSRTITSVTLTSNATTVPPGALTVVAGASISATVNVTTATGGGNANWRSTSWLIATTPSGTSTCVNHPNHDGLGSYSETFNINAPSTTGTYNAYFIAYQDGGCNTQPSTTFPLNSVIHVVAATSLSVSPATGTYGGTVDLSAALTSGGSPVSGKTISFTLNGGAVGSATTNASGVATLNGASLSGIGAGSYLAGIGANFAGDGSFASSNGTANLTVNQASSTTRVTCPPSVTYDGSAQTPCSATVTGAGGLSQSLTVNYTNNINAGTATASATFAGNANHTGSRDTKTFTIEKAVTVTTVSCGAGPFIFDGSPQTPCSATVTGPGGLNQVLTVNYTDNVNAGTATASASYAETANYKGSSDTKNFTIDKADSTTELSGTGTFTYDGNAHAATATVTGDGGLYQPVPVVYSGNCSGAPVNVNETPCTVNATYPGDINHKGSSANGTIIITKADATCMVNGYTGTYDGLAHGATGSCTGVGGVTLAGLDLGDSFTNVPGGTANWTFNGGTNYNDASGDVAIVINRANATIDVYGYEGTYDGAAHGVGGTAMGVGGVDLSGSLKLGATFTNVPGGTAYWTFNGGTNYHNASGSVPIVIYAKSVTGSVTAHNKIYDGNVIATIATCTVNGKVGLDDVACSGGAANFDTASAGIGKLVTATGLGLTGSKAGNYALNPSWATTNADVQPKTLVGNIAAFDKQYDGNTTATIATRSLDGVVIGDDVSYVGGTATFADKNAGTWLVTATGLGLAGGHGGNYNVNSTAMTYATIGALGFNGFLSPIGGADSTGGDYNNPIRTIKLGSTLPVKFDAFTNGGTPWLTGIHTIQAIKYSSMTTYDTPEVAATDAATSGNQFRLTDGQWHFNMSTKSGFSQGVWKIQAILEDGSVHYAWIVLKK